VHSLREHSVVVLGNHDLSLLAVGARTEEEQRKVNPDLLRMVQAEDRDELLDWLRLQKLVHVDRELGWMMVHAGLAPKWTTQMAEKCAEVEQQLHGNGYRKLFRNMYGDKPSWAPNLSGYDRSRAIINVHPHALLHPARPHRHRGQGHAGHPGAGLYPGSKCPAGSSATEDRLRPLVGAGPDHHPGRARHRHRRGLGRQADRTAAGHRRPARGAGTGRDVPAMPPAPRHPRPSPGKGPPRNKGHNGNAARQGSGKPGDTVLPAAGKANG
jgi:bis(5'-nucleosyl)-tetraphosphatase (symmetrical)